MRAGGQALTLIGTPRTFSILRSLASGAKGRLELRRDTGFPPQSTLRGQLNALEALGVVSKRRNNSFPSPFEHELTDGGRNLLTVALGLQRWLAMAPRGPVTLGDDVARAAIKGLIDGWRTTVLTELATGPLSLTGLDKRISAVSYPTIERCLETMRLAEQLDIGNRRRRGTPYALTGWLRRGVAPLALAARWEHDNQPEGASPLHRADIEGAVMLAAPLLDLPTQPSGISQLAVRVPDEDKPQRFLASLELQNGEIAFGTVYSERKPDAWASATVDTWFAALIDGEKRGLRLSGDHELPETILEALHQTLFAEQTKLPGKAADTEPQG